MAATQQIFGMASGYDTASIIEATMAQYRKPVTRMETKIQEYAAKQTAYESLNSMTYAFSSQVDVLAKYATWQTKSATSSNESLLSVTAADSAPLGSYSLRVGRLAQTQQLASSGFADADRTALVNQYTPAFDANLADLNGGAGVTLGTIKITDRSGNSADIDLSSAVTVQDVLDAINTESGINIRAEINADGDGFDIYDLTGSTTSALFIEEVGSTTAAELGILTPASGLSSTKFSGSDVYAVGMASQLSSFQDGAGLTLGTLRITDNDTSTDYDIDLSGATTVQDIADAINTTTGGSFSVTVSANGKGIRIEQADSHAFTVANDPNTSGDTTATQLRVEGTSSIGALNGGDLINGMNSYILEPSRKVGEVRIDQAGASLRTSTYLSDLNGGSGIYHGSIRITNRAGISSTIDLSMSETVQDVLDTINNTDGLNVYAKVNADGSGIDLIDQSGGANNLIVKEVGTGSTATDLGLLTSSTGVAGNVIGKQVYALQEATQLNTLNDGRGVDDGELGLIRINDASAPGGYYEVNLNGASTIQDIADAISNGTNNKIQVTIDGRGLKLTHADGLDFSVENQVTDPVDRTATDLGIEGSSTAGVLDGGNIFGGMNTTMLESLAGANKTGIALGTVDFTDRAGNTMSVDLTGAETLQQIIDRVNEQAATDGVSIELAINAVGNGIKLTDSSGGSGNLIVTDSSGSAASDLGIVTDATGVAKTSINGGDLDRRYMSLSTKLDDLNGGSGITRGQFSVVDGNNMAIGIDTSSMTTLGDLIGAITNSSLAVTARINDTGDGILIESTVAGKSVTITDLGSTAAQSLRIAGSGETIEGSFEEVIDVLEGETLTDVARKLAAAQSPITVGIINDGSSSNPFRMSITSKNSGLDGMLLIDTDIEGLKFQETSSAQDAMMLYGQAGSGNPIMLTSNTNTFSGTIPGLTLTANQANLTETITVNVARDTSGISTSVEAMVASYNDFKEFTELVTRWDTEENAPGLLYGEAEVTGLLDEVTDMFQDVVTFEGKKYTLADIGISFEYNEDEGVSYLELDSSKLSSMLSSNFELVQALLAQRANVATTQHASVSVTNAAGAGTSAKNLINGDYNTALGASNGYQGSAPVNEDQFILQFDETRRIDQLIIYNIDTPDMPAEEYAIKDYTIEYWDNATNGWELFREIKDNSSATNYYSMDENFTTDKFRITVHDTNAPDKRVRLMEIEAMETSGAAGVISERMDYLTNSTTGIFVTKDTEIEASITDLENQIEKMNTRLDSKEEALIRQYTAMEQTLSGLQSQSDYFSQQMSALTASKSK